MKQTLQIIITLLSIFVLPLFTSWLFDWWWISDNWTRQALITLLMLTEVVIGIYILKLIVKK